MENGKMQQEKSKILPANNAPHLPPGGVSVFVVVVVVLQAMLFLMHFMIYETLIAAFGDVAGSLGIPIAILSITFVTASLLAAKFDSIAVRAYYRLAGIWVAFIAPFCGASFGFVIIERLLPLVGLYISPRFSGELLFGVAVVVTLYGIWNGTRAEITRIKVTLPNLPEFWRGKKAVFFSDIHLGAFWGRGFSEKIVRKTNALNPEAVFIGGDLFDGVKCDAEALIEPFKNLRAPLGIFYITGNHEYIRESEIFLNAIRQSNIRMLQNEKVDLRGIQLLGVDYKDVIKKEDFMDVLERLHIDPNRPSILLKHVPDCLGVAERAGVSFSLMGHTHRGQFWPISLIARRVYESFNYGMNQLRTMTTYTSSGVGGWMSPFRLGTKSEIVEITFAGGS